MSNKLTQYILISPNEWSKKNTLPENLSDSLDCSKIDFSKAKKIDQEELMKLVEEFKKL